MFKQNPHPLYQAICEHSYTVEKVKKEDWFELRCLTHKLLIRNDSGRLCIFDHLKKEVYTFPYNYIKGISNMEIIFALVEGYVTFVRNSLNIKNTKIINLIIFEIIQKYPDIQGIDLTPIALNGQIFLKFEDRSMSTYLLKEENILSAVTNFCFINNIELKPYTFLNKPSNHEFLDHFQNYQITRKELLINPKIPLIS